MSESQSELLSRIKAEAVEARQHDCEHCGHPGSKHAFDIYSMRDGPNPCQVSCMICFDNETERLKKK